MISARPYPWFGGKARVAPLVWDRFGDTLNYVEPFFGGGAVLLSRPHDSRTETVNDIDGFLCNFWRAVKAEPDKVAEFAARPVNEIDLAAWRDWLFARKDEVTQRMWRDPDYYDCKYAGIWVWGICSTIGDGWTRSVPDKDAVNRPCTHLGSAGQGVNRPGVSFDRGGQGCFGTSFNLIEYFKQLQSRMARVRVMCGDWDRVCSPAVTDRIGLTGVFLDPPYDGYENTYAHGESVSDAVREWAIKNGDNPKMRIALCGYEGEHGMPDNWDCVAWKAQGGYGNGAVDNENKHRERIWFSPHCLQVTHLQLNIPLC